MDIVIPLGEGSMHENIELRYALRSMEKYVEHDKVVIVGERPKFLQNVIHIKAYDQSGSERKEANIFRKIREAIFDDRVSDDFIFANDDHYLLSLWKNEYLYSMSLERKLASKRPSESYRKSIANTIAMIGGGWYYDIHCPIVYNKARFENTVARAAWHKPWGYCIKSLYANLNDVTGRKYDDLKIGKTLLTDGQIRLMLTNRLFFSTGSNMGPGMMKVLAELYPNKSRYET